MERLNVLKEVAYLGARETPLATALQGSKIIVITGQSSNESCLLPPDQTRFCQNVLSPNLTTPTLGFPWLPGFLRPRTSEPGLLAASWRNVLQFLAAQFSPRFQRGCANLLSMHLSDSTKTVIITGSCGYQITAVALSRLNLRSEVLLITLGAVGFTQVRSPLVKTFHIRGGRDLVSLFSSVSCEVMVDCGHLDYWRCPEAAALCKRRIDDFL